MNIKITLTPELVSFFKTFGFVAITNKDDKIVEYLSAPRNWFKKEEDGTFTVLQTPLPEILLSTELSYFENFYKKHIEENE